MSDVSMAAASAERHIPFLASLGARLERVSDGEAVVVVDLVPELLVTTRANFGSSTRPI